jgi:hypothetical protein
MAHVEDLWEKFSPTGARSERDATVVETTGAPDISIPPVESVRKRFRAEQMPRLF